MGKNTLRYENVRSSFEMNYFWKGKFIKLFFLIYIKILQSTNKYFKLNDNFFQIHKNKASCEPTVYQTSKSNEIFYIKFEIWA